MLRIVSCVFIALAALCVSDLARAQEDYSRAGCYLGLGGAVALPLRAEDALEDMIETVPAPTQEERKIFPLGTGADVDKSLGLHARAGCRGTWGGGELHYEWTEGFDVKVAGRDFKVDGWALTLDGKLYPVDMLHEVLLFFEVPVGPWQYRVQPFGTVGFGYLTFDLSQMRKFLDKAARDRVSRTTGLSEPVGPPDGFEDWDFALRLGGGLDIYVTRNIAISLEVTQVLPLSNALDDMAYLSSSWGFLYRF